MNLKHKVRINVTGTNGKRETVLEGGETKVRSRFLDRLLGRHVGILVLTPGASVSNIEVVEVSTNGGCRE